MRHRTYLWWLTILLAIATACAPADQTAVPTPGTPTTVAQAVNKPSLTVSAPASGALVLQGSTVEVKSTSSDPRGITRIELWVDGVLYRVDVTREQEGLPSVSITQTWPATELGSHLFLIKALNRDGVASDAQTINISVVPSGAPTVTRAATATPGGTPLPAPTAPPTGPAPEGCAPDAAFVSDVTVPDGTPFKPGEAIIKTWRVRNSGRCAWEAGTQLLLTDGNPMGAPRSAPVPQTAPNATADLTVRMVAPATPAEYTGKWKLATAGGATFGQSLTVVVRVTPPPPPSPTPGPTPPAGVAVSFIADRYNLPYGDCATLKWDVDNAQSVRLDGRGVVGHDTRLACPTATTEYLLEVSVPGSDSPIEKLVTLTIVPPLKAAGATINAGDAVDLESAIKNQGDVDMLWTASRTLQPRTNATFTVIGTKAALTDVPQAECLNATGYSGATLSGTQVAAGTILCFKTSSGRNGKLRISDSSGTLAFQWIVW